MQTTSLGPFSGISRLTLGGGGIGQGWGETSRDEAVATLHAAVDAGVNLIDTAPLYLNCEVIVGEAFGGAPPAGLKFTTKCRLGGPPKGETAARLEASLAASLAAMKLDHADIYFLHTNICDDDYVYARGNHRRDRFSTPWSTYVDEVIPAMQALKSAGRIGAWGITGIGVPDAILKAIAHPTKPDVVQAIANLMDSAGAIRGYAEPPRPREIIAAAKAAGIGVMGVRAVQAGALTLAMDRELSPENGDLLDYDRAASFRSLCAQWSVDPALVSHRYALHMAGIDTLVLGVKNRAELTQCLTAEGLGPLTSEAHKAIDALGLSDPTPLVL